MISPTRLTASAPSIDLRAESSCELDDELHNDADAPKQESDQREWRELGLDLARKRISHNLDEVGHRFACRRKYQFGKDEQRQDSEVTSNGNEARCGENEVVEVRRVPLLQ